MKVLRVACFVAASLSLLGNVSGQRFANLDFEQSTIISSSPTGYGFNTGAANVPGWTQSGGWADANYSGGSTLIYNNQPLDDPGVALEGTDYWTAAIEGDYSIFLLGGSHLSEGGTNGVSIGQTGRIPLTAQSITYWGASWNRLNITFNGHILSLYAISNTANYTIYGGDISAYAGQTGELLFTAPWVAGGGLIDNIHFSSQPIPEPDAFSLLAIGILFVGEGLRPNYHGLNSKRPNEAATARHAGRR